MEERPLPAYSEPLIAAESMVVSLLSAVKQLSTGIFKVRPSLCRLNNLRHALALGRIDAEAAPGAWQLVADIARLRGSWFSTLEADRIDLARYVAARVEPALREALWALGERSEARDGAQVELRLGAPWSNVTLVAGGVESTQVGETVRLPSLRSAKVAEVLWRAARPRIALHPKLIALLAGSDGPGHVSEFRSARQELVDGYHRFMAEDGPGYAEIGLASAFSRAPAHLQRRTRN